MTKSQDTENMRTQMITTCIGLPKIKQSALVRPLSQACLTFTSTLPNACNALLLINCKDQDTLTQQSGNLLKQSVGQVVLCQLTESGYTTAAQHGVVTTVKQHVPKYPELK